MTHHPAIQDVTWTPENKHVDCIDWPNGLGFTPCSAKYREVFYQQRAIFDPQTYGDGSSLEDLSPADYNRYCHLENELLNLQAHGHVGKGERW